MKTLHAVADVNTADVKLWANLGPAIEHYGRWCKERLNEIVMFQIQVERDATPLYAHQIAYRMLRDRTFDADAQREDVHPCSQADTNPFQTLVERVDQLEAELAQLKERIT